MVFQGIYGTGDPRTIGLDHLVQLLTRLKSFGFQNASAGLWDEESARASRQSTPGDIPTLHHDPFPDLLRSLAESKSCLAVLDEVRDHLRRRICRLRKACAPFVLKNGFTALPDEILSDIFEAGHRMTEGCIFAKSVSHVSRRFRQVSLRTPLLWTRVSLDYMDADGQLQAFLSRSGTLDLEVSIDKYVQNETILSYLQILRPFVHRWSRLQIYTATAKPLLMKVGLTNFPRLQHLYNAWYTNMNFSEQAVPLLSSHSKRIKAPSDYIFLAQLTSLELLHVDTAVHVALLTRALYCVKNLKNLSLSFDGCSEVVELPDIPNVLGNHSVVIDTLQVAILNHTTQFFVSLLYKGLQFLSPSTVRIHMEDLLSDDEEYDLEDFFFMDDEDNFPSGSSITIQASRMKEIRFGCQPSPVLTGIVERCQKTRTVHFECPIVSFLTMGSTDWRQFSSLRHLRFKGCDNLTEPEVDELARNLMCGTAEGTGLQSLEIFSCRKISEEFLVGLGDEVGPKLKWKMCDCE